VQVHSTDFTNAGADFFNSGFMPQPVNFTSGSLNTEHPYKSPDGALNSEFQFSAEASGKI
jgi:hypothetical protein